MATDSSQRLKMEKMAKLHFLHNQWSDVIHIWQLQMYDHLKIVYIIYVFYDKCFVWLPWNFKFKKRKSLQDNSFNSTEAVWLHFCMTVAWVRAIQNGKNCGDLCIRFVGLATDGSSCGYFESGEQAVVHGPLVCKLTWAKGSRWAFCEWSSSVCQQIT